MVCFVGIRWFFFILYFVCLDKILKKCIDLDIVVKCFFILLWLNGLVKIIVMCIKYENLVEWFFKILNGRKK